MAQVREGERKDLPIFFVSFRFGSIGFFFVALTPFPLSLSYSLTAHRRLRLAAGRSRRLSWSGWSSRSARTRCPARHELGAARRRNGDGSRQCRRQCSRRCRSCRCCRCCHCSPRRRPGHQGPGPFQRHHAHAAAAAASCLRQRTRQRERRRLEARGPAPRRQRGRLPLRRWHGRGRSCCCRCSRCSRCKRRFRSACVQRHAGPLSFLRTAEHDRGEPAGARGCYLWRKRKQREQHSCCPARVAPEPAEAPSASLSAAAAPRRHRRRCCCC